MFRQANPRRQLNAEETRVYAAGMAAKRRGENTPAQRLPPELFKFWRMGWNRAGRPLGTPWTCRSTDHNTKSEGVHMVRTEVATLEEALDVIAIQQRREKAAATNAKPPDWHREVHMHNMRQRSPKTSPKALRDIAIAKDTVADAEQRLVERIEGIIEVLSFSIEELSAVSAMRPHYPLVSQSNLIDVIRKLCLMIARPMPEFGVGRKPQQTATRRCVECGTELSKDEAGEYCRHCNRPPETIHIASEFRREQVRVKEEVQRLERVIRRTEKVIDGDYERHSGHPGEDSARLEISGRPQDLDNGSTPADAVGEDHSRDTEG
jgi:hypothetical protein